VAEVGHRRTRCAPRSARRCALSRACPRSRVPAPTRRPGKEGSTPSSSAIYGADAERHGTGSPSQLPTLSGTQRKNLAGRSGVASTSRFAAPSPAPRPGVTPQPHRRDPPRRRCRRGPSRSAVTTAVPLARDRSRVVARRPFARVFGRRSRRRPSTRRPPPPTTLSFPALQERQVSHEDLHDHDHPARRAHQARRPRPRAHARQARLLERRLRRRALRAHRPHLRRRARAARGHARGLVRRGPPSARASAACCGSTAAPRGSCAPGTHRYWTGDDSVELRVYDVDQPVPELTDELRALIPAAELLDVTVQQHQRGLKYVNGRFAEQLGPGRYLCWNPPDAKVAIAVLDTRRQLLNVPAQELMTKDKVTLRLTLTLEYAPTDLPVAVHAVADPARGAVPRGAAGGARLPRRDHARRAARGPRGHDPLPRGAGGAARQGPRRRRRAGRRQGRGAPPAR
jgi:hypothetical protein